MKPLKYYVMWKIAGTYYGPNGPYESEEIAEAHRLDIKGYEGVEHAWTYSCREGDNVLSSEEMNKCI